jgi:hypothetical protein
VRFVPILGESPLQAEMESSTSDVAVNAEVAETSVAVAREANSPSLGVIESTPQATPESSQRNAEKGQYYLHAGLLVLNLWVADFAKGFQSWRGIFVQWLYQIFAGAVNFERARYLPRHEFSRFLGQAAVGVSKSRALLSKLAQKYFMPCLNMLFKLNLENIAKTRETTTPYFYLDGHFDPYYGQTGILPGWCCILNRTMTGTNHYMIHNELGYPIFKELTQQISQLEKKIKRLERIEAKGYERLDYRKKQIFDHLRFTARNIFYNAIAET